MSKTIGELGSLDDAAQAVRASLTARGVNAEHFSFALSPQKNYILVMAACAETRRTHVSVDLDAEEVANHVDAKLASCCVDGRTPEAWHARRTAKAAISRDRHPVRTPVPVGSTAPETYGAPRLSDEEPEDDADA